MSICLHVCVCATLMPGACRDQERAPELLEIGSCERVLPTIEPFLQLPDIHFLFPLYLLCSSFLIYEMELILVDDLTQLLEALNEMLHLNHQYKHLKVLCNCLPASQVLGQEKRTKKKKKRLEPCGP